MLDCSRQHYGKGLCKFHYQRARNPPKTMPLEDRFWAKVDKNGPVPAHRPELGPCWIWTAARFKRGYGKFGVEPILNWRTGYPGRLRSEVPLLT